MTQYLIRSLWIAACAATLAPIGFCQTTAKPPAEKPTGQQVAPRLPADMLAELSGSFQRLARKVSPAVVKIEVTGFGATQEAGRQNAALIVRHRAIGAGVIVDPAGYIMTNAHVIEGAQRIRVVLSAAVPTALYDVSGAGKSQILDAKVIGLQSEADLALLKVEASNLPSLRFNLEREPQPGQLVFAIGSPEGLQNSITMGVISSVWRQPDPNNPMAYLQTDAPINPGNSGGPLVDVDGKLIGLNTFIISNSGGSEGLGFAIPAGVVHFVYQSLRKYGHVEHVQIGVLAQTITPTLAEGLGLAKDWGVVISDVLPYGPADAAGLKSGDVILTVDGHPMLDLHRFMAALYQHPRDQALKIDVLRDKAKLSFNVRAVSVPDRMNHFANLVDPAKNYIEPLAILALDFNNELRSLLPNMRIGSGVLVVGRAPGFNSANTGLQPGDVIHSLNRTPIASIEQLRSAVAQLKSGDAVVLWIERQGQLQFLAFEME
jgi:serine protease Do